MDELKQVLLQYKSNEFLVIEPGGNNGDRLIYMGMEKKLGELGIRYRVIRYKERIFTPLYIAWRISLKVISVFTKMNRALDITINKIEKKLDERIVETNLPRNTSFRVILIHGGGNINDLWGHGIRLLKKVICRNPNSVIIVAPQTYWFRETRFSELFSTLKEIYLFCRERYSYKLLKTMNLAKNIHIKLSHDTSFYLSKNDFNPRDGDYDLVCLRKDVESVLLSKIDLKLLQTIKESRRKIIFRDISLIGDFKQFLHLTENARRVYSDRLHAAIFAAILGKDTILYSNNFYYKIKGVFDYSLRSRYLNVKLVDFRKNPELILR